MNAALVLLCLLQDGGPPAERIRAILRERFGDVDASRCDAYAAALARSVPASTTASRQDALLKSLPEAVEFHALVAGRHPIFPAAHSVEPAFMLRGLDLQMDYLTARVDRWCRTEPAAGDGERIRSQIDVIAGTAAAALREKLPGGKAAEWIDGRTAALKRAWVESLDLPLQEYLDRPLSEAELGTVLRGIRESIATKPILALPDEDYADSGKLADKGVEALLREVREAAFRATAICFAEFDPYEQRSRAWEDERRTLAEALAGPVLPRPAPRILARASGKSAGEGRAKVSGPAASPEPAASGPAESLPTTSPTEPRSRLLGIAAALAVAAGLAFVLLRARRPKGA